MERKKPNLSPWNEIKVIRSLSLIEYSYMIENGIKPLDFKELLKTKNINDLIKEKENKEFYEELISEKKFIIKDLKSMSSYYLNQCNKLEDEIIEYSDMEEDELNELDKNVIELNKLNKKLIEIDKKIEDEELELTKLLNNKK